MTPSRKQPSSISMSSPVGQTAAFPFAPAVTSIGVGRGRREACTVDGGVPVLRRQALNSLLVENEIQIRMRGYGRRASEPTGDDSLVIRTPTIGPLTPTIKVLAMLTLWLPSSVDDQARARGAAAVPAWANVAPSGRRRRCR